MSIDLQYIGESTMVELDRQLSLNVHNAQHSQYAIVVFRAKLVKTTDAEGLSYLVLNECSTEFIGSCWTGKIFH